MNWYTEPEIDVETLERETVFSYLDAVREGELMYWMDDTAFSLAHIIADRFEVSLEEGKKLYWEWLKAL